MSSRACNVALGCLVAVLFAFCVARSRHELRWSAIAYADAENIIAATHFVKEGFKAHYFLNYHTPGYLGKARRNVSSLGYDSQYPPFGEILNATIIRYFGEDLFVLRVTGIIFSCLALLLFYGVLARFFDRQASLFGTAFIALSVSFLDHADAVCLENFSETFRFGAMFLFLLAEDRLKAGRKAAAVLLFSGVWAVTFLEAMNSNHYVVFIQLFFLLYYFFRRRAQKFPWRRVLFLASAAVTAGALRVAQNVMALGGWEALRQLTVDSPLSGEKTAPLNKGILNFFSFWTYFARMLEDDMVRSHFGFGFALVFLAAGAVLLYPDPMREAATLPSKDRGLSYKQAMLLLLIPSLSWWAMFPNHAASFFWMPKHLWPVMAAVFGLALSMSVNALRGKEAGRALKWASALVIAGCLWTHAIFAGKYLKEYPNLISPQTRTQMSGWGELGTQDIAELVEVFKAVRQKTAYGDIVLVGDLSFQNADSFFAFYAMRRLDFAGSLAEFEAQLKDLQEYRRTGAERYKIFGPLKLYALARKDSGSELWKALRSRYPESRDLPHSWVLFSLDPPPKTRR
ncbi:MAG: hypothetical protein A3A86_01460 [Elusimicrobia bacterium RIFCSPLOWO2_01_FULL_60_11]|nr:MAG: hypothetical protein A3A86_01460 [Elusimicrobia bacterium RIFCSPLOWO2_01_FULL_60_11]